MKVFTKSIMVLAITILLLSMLPIALAQVEKRPAEAAAENLFNKGIGSAWTGGEPFSSGAPAGESQVNGIAVPNLDLRIIGYLDVASGMIIASDGGNSLHFKPSPGNYPVYGYFEADKLMGIFIDFAL
jgi:hypothetical protein